MSAHEPVIHCEDAAGSGRSLCGVGPWVVRRTPFSGYGRPLFAFVSDAVTCKTCLSWPKLVAEAFEKRRKAMKAARAGAR